jgi:hypothetical protein
LGLLWNKVSAGAGTAPRVGVAMAHPPAYCAIEAWVVSAVEGGSVGSDFFGSLTLRRALSKPLPRPESWVLPHQLVERLGGRLVLGRARPARKRSRRESGASASEQAAAGQRVVHPAPYRDRRSFSPPFDEGCKTLANRRLGR